MTSSLMRVLVQADRPSLKGLAQVLESLGFSISIVYSTEECIEFANLFGVNTILLPFDNQRISGSSLSRLRETQISNPIIMIADSHDGRAAADMLNGGADDFIAEREVSCTEIASRIRAIVRRHHGFSQAVIKIGLLSIDLDQGTVRFAQRPVHLTAMEYTILQYMALNAGQVVTKSCLLDQLYGDLDAPDLKIVDVFLHRVRNKLSQVGADAKIIATIRGVGYLLGTDGMQSSTPHYSTAA